MLRKQLLTLGLALFLFCFAFGCSKNQDSNKLVYAVTADYPPFEYISSGILTGFDVELAELIAEKLGKKAEFKDIQFSSILPAVQSGIVDAAISTLTITEQRKKNFDFSIPYYFESLAIVYDQDTPLTSKNDLMEKTIACQLGSTMEIWLKDNAQKATIITLDTNLFAIEALKAGRVDGVLIDTAQAKVFTNKNSSLAYKVIANADTGYGIAMKKDSPLVAMINEAIQNLQDTGELAKLQKKYFKVQ